MAKRSQQRSFEMFDEGDTAPSSAVPSGPANELTAEGPTDDAGRRCVPAISSPMENATADVNQISKTPADPRFPLAGKTVYVVDSHSLIYQIFHALPEMTSPEGEPVGAVFGFVRDVLFLIEEKKPTHLFCAFDMPGDTFRHEIYPEYKIQRESMPEPLRTQIPKIREALSAMNVAQLGLEGFEADDILATLAKRVEELGGECLLVTGDKDCRQLITDRVKIYNVRKNEIFDAEKVREVWNIAPTQVVDFQALVGDPTDNVPGVPLIGPKMAAELLAKFGTLDEILAHPTEVPGKKKQENLVTFKDQAILSRKLVKLDDQVPVELDFTAGRVGGMDAAKTAELFRRWGFRSLSEKFGKLEVQHAPPEWKSDYRTVLTLDELRHIVHAIREKGSVSLDTETTHIHPRWAKLVGISLACNPELAWYIPIRAPLAEPTLKEQDVLEVLRPVLEDPNIRKIGQNLKYDIIVLKTAGVNVAGVAFDTMIADYLLDAGGRNHNLNEMSRRFLNHDPIPIEKLIGTGKQQKRMDDVPVEQITQYAAEDADVALRLALILEPQLQRDQLEKLNAEVELPLIDVLVEMEYNGVKVDTDLLARLSGEFGQRMDALQLEIFEHAGHEFNIASPKQLGEVLFNELHLPVIRKTKTGPSTDADVLEELAAQHPLPAKIIEYRQYAKLKGTYVDALPLLIHPETGRVHTSLNQVVAVTGRLSSNDPNLQNIPIRHPVGREIRAAFIPGQADWQLLSADYSQIELRVLAHFAQDPALITSFINDEDVHTRVASEVYRVPLAEVTKEMRRNAKAINFGVIYGQSPFGLAKSLSIEQDEAAAFIDAYFAQYPGVDAFLEKVLADCRKSGYVNTILGRRRAIVGVRDFSERRGSPRQRNLPERTAINTVIQGSAADFIKQAMIRVYRRLRSEGLQARLLLQIHDELLLEVPPAEIETVSALVTQEMAAVASLAVPLKVDIKSGANWAECE